MTLTTSASGVFPMAPFALRTLAHPAHRRDYPI